MLHLKDEGVARENKTSGTVFFFPQRVVFRAKVRGGVVSLSRSLLYSDNRGITNVVRVLGKLLRSSKQHNSCLRNITQRHGFNVCYGHVLNHLICNFKSKLLLIFLEGHGFIKDGGRGLVHTYRTWVFCQPLVKKSIPRHTSGVLKIILLTSNCICRLSVHVKITPKHEVLGCNPEA